MWLATSREAQALPPLAFLNARRSEWGIENGLHYVLDVSGDEDRRLKVRTPNSLAVLSLLDRLSVAIFKRSRQKHESYYDRLVVTKTPAPPDAPPELCTARVHVLESILNAP